MTFVDIQKRRAEAVHTLAAQEAETMGLAHQPAQEVGRYAANLVRMGASGHRALVLGRQKGSRALIAAALKRAAHYARVRMGDDGWVNA